MRLLEKGEAAAESGGPRLTVSQSPRFSASGIGPLVPTKFIQLSHRCSHCVFIALEDTAVIWSWSQAPGDLPHPLDTDLPWLIPEIHISMLAIANP
ncbi:hypothetical protein V6N13_036264 [Hibiscus sabdariffa]|uniref:Uncharacterized protein n=1 Tax=Hibiscus sabdariffa TaxID=183260 RepID=A0ABR2S6W6_9ROSI